MNTGKRGGVNERKMLKYKKNNVRLSITKPRGLKNSPNRFDKGFTLLEMVIALSLTMVILGIVLSSLRLGISTWESGEREEEALQSLRLVSAHFSYDVSSLVHYYPPVSNAEEEVGKNQKQKEGNKGVQKKGNGTKVDEKAVKEKPKPRLLAFKGEQRSLRFIAKTSPVRKQNRFMSVKEVHYFLGEDDKGEKALYYEESFLHPVRSFQSFHGETSGDIPRVQDVQEGEEQPDEARPVVLINRVKDLRFSYHLLAFNTADNTVQDLGWKEGYNPVETYEQELFDSENRKKEEKQKPSGKKVQTIDKIKMIVLLEGEKGGADEEKGVMLPPLEATVYTGIFPGYTLTNADDK